MIEEEIEIKEELAEDGSKTGIEAENEDEAILDPFNPDSISIESKVVAMDTLKRRLEQGSICLAPNFQRNEVWDPTRRSRLIESLMLKIPLPMFYVAANEKGQWDVVDGLQRLSTIRDFLTNKLALENLEFLGKKVNGKKFDDIDNDPTQVRLINTIMETEMRFTIINPGTPEEVKRNIFKRINTGGMPLTSQEIRHALYQGKASDLLLDLVKTPEFMDAIGKIDDSRMGARELVLRFLAFLIFPISDYQSDMDKFLSNAMRVINCMPELDNHKLLKIYDKNPIPEIKNGNIKSLKRKFILGMRRGEIIFGEHTFRKSLPNSRRKSPVNKALFETWANILSELNEKDFNTLEKRKKNLLYKYTEKLKISEFNESISKHATQKTRGVNKRYDVINKIVNETLTGSSDDN